MERTHQRIGEEGKEKRQYSKQLQTDTYTRRRSAGFKLVFGGKGKGKQEKTENVENVREATICYQKNNFPPPLQKCKDYEKGKD